VRFIVYVVAFLTLSCICCSCLVVRVCRHVGEIYNLIMTNCAFVGGMITIKEPSLELGELEISSHKNL
jgi:hypothetical protein